MNGTPEAPGHLSATSPNNPDGSPATAAPNGPDGSSATLPDRPEDSSATLPNSPDGGAATSPDRPDGSGERDLDSRARRAALEDLDRNLFLEAGAGTGKTTALVGRIVELVRGGVALANIAAITFTEKAAAELRERLRQELVAQAGQAAAGGADTFARALDDLDAAAVCTLHSFAQRILREHTTEAGLPPRLELLDEIGADMEFADAWERFVEELLADPQAERALLLADALRMRMAGLRSVARRMADNWDLAVEHIPDLSGLPEVPPLELADIVGSMHALADERRHHDPPLDLLSGQPRGVPDGLYLALSELSALAYLLEGVGELEAAPLLEEVADGGVPRGRKADWHPDFDKEGVRDRLRELRGQADSCLRVVGGACAARLLARLAEFTASETDRRRRQGRLIFHDLLVLTRDLLRRPDVGEAVRLSLHDRYQRLLIDEFQDTDPIQVDLAFMIAGALPTARDIGEAPTARDIGDGPLGRGPATGDGRLFFVGDPKQSLYRFRRADIGTYLRVADRLGLGARETLSRNWRSSPEIVDWVNAVFGRLIGPAAGSQPAYVPLEAGRRRPETDPRSPVLLLGTSPHGDALTAEDLRLGEFAEVAELAKRAVAEGWPVREGTGTRPLRLRDVCVLIPARTALSALMETFDAAAVPYRIESSSLVYGTRAEIDLLAVLRAVDDPSDHLAVVTALRSAAFGFGDDELYTYRRLCGAGHRPWDYLSPQPDHPVAEALAWLAELHAARIWCSPGEIVDRVVRERRLMELAFAEYRHRDVWRRLRRAVDQARAFSDSTGGTLRAYLRWVDMQTADGARVVEALVPETDDDAVRVMTVHAAKGLEFPFVAVAGFSSTAVPQRGVRTGGLVFPPGEQAACRLSRRVASANFESSQAREETHEFHEDLRKLYVACTRAQDYLAVSLRRTGRYRKSWEYLTASLTLEKMTLAEVLAHAVADVASPQAAGSETAPHPLSLGNDQKDDAAAGSAAARALPPLTVALERKGWTAGRPVETLPALAAPGAEPGTAGMDGSPEPAAGSPGADGLGAAGRGDGHDGAARPREATAAAGSPSVSPAAPGVVAVPPPQEWHTLHRELLAVARRSSLVAASQVAGVAGVQGDGAGAAPVRRRRPGERDPAPDLPSDPGLDKDGPEDETPSGGGGRYGTALGRAVHAVLQRVDLTAGAPDGSPGADARAAATARRGSVGGADADRACLVDQRQQRGARRGSVGGADADGSLEAAARRWAGAEGIYDMAGDVVARVRDALGSPAVREAGRCRHWHEFYAGTEIAGRFLEGFIDLLYEAPDGSFVVVDFKTHAAEEPPALAQKPAYRLQIAAYALMLQEATGRTVSRCVFVFLGPNGAHEVQVDDLPQAIAEVRAALTTP